MALTNTHATVKKFIQHGFTEEQAEAVVEAINDQNNQLVTKTDLAIAVSDLKSEITAINTNIKWIMAIGLLIVGILLKNTLIH
jgi:uncharacterized FlaG/YvyC family protein